jgi:PhzF family phenazine biosynthesis protein
MTLPLLVVDAFTPRPFAGNPAAVCILSEAREEAWMQNVARDMNLSETAFVLPRPGSDMDFGLRWFTPAVEVDLCGHATLASAHALWEIGRLPRERAARFHTRSGMLDAKREGDFIALNFPTRAVRQAAPPAGLAAALGAEPVWVGGYATNDMLVELASEAAVRGLAPDFAKLREVDARGFIVTARGSGEYDFVSRFFGPRVGIDEDPVTGAAHCVLAPYWGEKLGKKAMTGYQASARGGVVRVRHEGERTMLLGQAVLVSRGELLV